MKILMCEPTYFDVEYEINAWMHTENAVDKDLAREQWQKLKEHYENLGIEVQLIEPAKGLPDMVFTANGGLVIDGKVMLPRFRYPERQPETPKFKQWFESRGYKDILMPKHCFEGEGDALVANGKILAGFGFRSDKKAHRELAEYFGREVVSLHLINDKFYHIDTCLAVLSQDTVAYFPGAFDKASQIKLAQAIPNIIEATAEEAEGFGLNATSFKNTIIMSNRSDSLAKKIESAGYNVIQTPITEFQKSGGGVKCMSLVLR